MPDLILESIKNFRKLSQSLDLIDLESVKQLHSRIGKYIDSREKLELTKKEKQVSIEETAKYLFDWLKQEGITLDELLESEQEKKKSIPNIRKPKYQYINAAGQVAFWSGAGKMPKSIKVALDTGKNILSDFLIPSKKEE